MKYQHKNKSKVLSYTWTGMSHKILVKIMKAWKKHAGWALHDIWLRNYDIIIKKSLLISLLWLCLSWNRMNDE